MHFADVLPQLLLAIAALLVGLSKGGLPAIGMLAVPVMALGMPPIKAAALLLPVYVASDVVGVYLYRKNFSATNLKILIPAGILGVVIGWSTASLLSDRAVGFLIGLLGVGFCLKTWLIKPATGEPAKPKVGKGLFWGSLAGFTSFISHAGGPPFQIYVLPQRLQKLEFAGTSTILFAVINAAKIIPYANLRPYTVADLTTAAAILPVALLGTVLGAYLTKRITDKWFFRFVQVALFTVSLKLIADSLSPLFT